MRKWRIRLVVKWLRGFTKWTPVKGIEIFLTHSISVKFRPPLNFDSFQKTQKTLVFLKSKDKNRIIKIISIKVINNV